MTTVEEFEDLKVRVTRLEVGQESRVDSLAAVLADTRGDTQFIRSSMATSYDALRLGQRMDGVSAGYTEMRGTLKRLEESHDKLTVSVDGMQEPLSHMRLDMSMVKVGLPSLHHEMTEVRQDIATLQGDVTELKADVAVLKSDVAVLKSDVTELKADVAVLKADVTELKGGQVQILAMLTQLVGDSAKKSR
ncbi:MAG TPA: hypothetical protein VGX23_29720 [Actinocrinis sp.]|nr:hypothetical protein [Actinocrinis sp.]